MAKKIRFPLEMADGTLVRELDELRGHFDLSSVLGYYNSGKLLTWLKDRYYSEEVTAVENLDPAASDFQQNLCRILGVAYTGSVDMDELNRRQERITRLRTYTDEQAYIDQIDVVAFDQKELADLIEAGVQTIYLCNARFTITVSCKNVHYIGIDGATAFLSGLKDGEELSPDIRFTDVEIENPPVPKPCVVDFTAKVKGVNLSSTGRGGFRTIQVELEDVAIIDGVRYDHIPVLSAELFDKMDLCEGDLVRIHRVGDVIPSITIEERNGGKKIHLPDRCPTCGGELVREAKKLKCIRYLCADNKAGRILNFMDHAGIKGIGEAVSMDMVNVGLDDIVKILESDLDKFEKIGWSEDRAKKFQKELKDAISEMRDYEILAAIGMPGVGIETAKKIMKDTKFIDFVSSSYYPYDITELSSNRFFNDLLIEFGKPMLQKLYPYIKHFTTKEDFENMKTVGHTGGDPSKETKKLIRDLGWDLVNGKKFDYLIVPSHNHSDELVELAKIGGIPIYTQEEFHIMFA